MKTCTCKTLTVSDAIKYIDEKGYSDSEDKYRKAYMYMKDNYKKFPTEENQIEMGLMEDISNAIDHAMSDC